MAVREAKAQRGVLKLGTAPDEMDVSCQVTNTRINSNYDDDGDAQETLCGDIIPAGRKMSGRALAGTFIQDWTVEPNVTSYLYLHDLETVPFTYTPNGTYGPTITGSLRIEVPGETYGGDVASRITSDFEWAITEELTFAPPLGGGAAQAAAQTEPAA